MQFLNARNKGCKMWNTKYEKGTERIKDMEIVRKHMHFTGRVQFVGFRYKSSYIARSLGLTGWVKNNADDSVEMEAQGTEEQIFRMLKMLNKDAYIRIEKIDTKKIPVEEEKGFRVIGY